MLYCKVQRRIRYATFKKYISGIKASLTSLGIESDTNSMPIFTLAKRSWKQNETSHASNKKGKVTVRAITKRLARIGNNPKEIKVFASIVTCFNMLLRISELLQAKVGDATIRDNGVSSIWLARTKTKKHGEKAQGKGRLLASCLRLLCAGKPDSANICDITKDDIQTGIAQLMGSAFRPGAHTTHSMRRGAAQALYDAGWSVDALMAIGRWASSAWKTYVDTKPRAIATQTWIDENARRWKELADSTLPNLV
jgi:integrase